MDDMSTITPTGGSAAALIELTRRVHALKHAVLKRLRLDIP
jgi:hypothetical protein